MDSSLWVLLLHSPELPVPYPWERCFDISTEILFYKNQLDGTIVLDLRPRLHLGESLVYVNSLWIELTGHYPMNYRPDLSSGTNQPGQGPPIILYSNCCGRLIYLFVPELVQNCPLCGCFIYYLG